MGRIRHDLANHDQGKPISQLLRPRRHPGLRAGIPEGRRKNREAKVRQPFTNSHASTHFPSPPPLPAQTKTLLSPNYSSLPTRAFPNSWIPLLPQTLHAHHLTHIHTSRHSTPPPSLPHQLDVFLLTYEELACKTLDRLPVRDGDSGGGHGDTLREMIEAASHEGRRGVAWGMDRLVVVGRKPGAIGSGEMTGGGSVR